jgi:hypothetical protein
MTDILHQILYNRDAFVDAVYSSKMSNEKKKTLLKLCLMNKRELLETAAHNHFLKKFKASPIKGRKKIDIPLFTTTDEMIKTMLDELKP